MGSCTAAFSLAYRYQDGEGVITEKAAKPLCKAPVCKRAAKFGGDFDALASLGFLKLIKSRERSVRPCANGCLQHLRAMRAL